MLLTKEYSRAKLADFDSAKRVPDEYTEAGLKPLGTKGFASPEVLKQVLFNHDFVGGDVVVSALDLRSDGWWFKVQSLQSCCFLRQETLHHVVSLSPSKCTNRYWRG